MIALLALPKQLVAKEQTEFGDIAGGRWVRGEHFDHLAGLHIPYFVVQHHYRLGTEQAAGIELTSRRRRLLHFIVLINHEKLSFRGSAAQVHQ